MLIQYVFLMIGVVFGLLIAAIAYVIIIDLQRPASKKAEVARILARLQRGE